VAPAPRDELVKDVARVREFLAERKVDDITDLVAVPSPSPALARAQAVFRRVDVDENDLTNGQDHSLNAVHVEVAKDVDADGWRALRKAARASGVNVVLERVDTTSFEVELL
jgi:hypothetical protein